MRLLPDRMLCLLLGRALLSFFRRLRRSQFGGVLRHLLRFCFPRPLCRRMGFAFRGFLCLALGFFLRLCPGRFFACLQCGLVRGLFRRQMRRIFRRAPRFFLRPFQFLMRMLGGHARFFSCFLRSLFGGSLRSPIRSSGGMGFRGACTRSRAQSYPVWVKSWAPPPEQLGPSIQK